MKKQVVAMLSWLLAVVHSLLSNPQRVRQVVFVVAVALALAAICVPSLITLADAIGGGGH